MPQRKTRLTITLPESTLKLVDKIIDRKEIRNRSHAIEHLISLSLKPTISTAVILAGGMHDETRDIMRPLTVINGKALILHTVELLAKHGVRSVVIASNSRGAAIQEVVGDGSALGLKIKYHLEDKPLGTAGALAAVKNMIPQDEPFLVVSGDILTDINLSDMASFHIKSGAKATIAVKPRQTKKTYDNVFIQGQTVVDFLPSQPKQEIGIVNASVYLFEPSIFELIPRNKPAMLEKDVLPQLAAAREVVAFVFQGMWFDIEADPTYVNRV